MLSLIETPPQVSLSRNPVRFTIRSDNFLEMAGAKPTFSLTFPTTGSSGDLFTLAWGSRSIAFECVPHPDESGQQVPDSSVESDLYRWVAIVARYLALNYYIARDFAVYADQDAIRFQAYSHGDDYHLSVDSIWGLSGENTGAAPVLRPFYKIGIQLQLKLNGTWTQVAEEVLPVDELGDAAFDIHPLFADHLSTGFSFPESPEEILVRCDSMIREYRIRYFEQYGSPIVPSILHQSDSFFALFGGISLLQSLIDSRKETSFWERLTYSRRFLTWLSESQAVDRDTPVKLYFLVPSEQSQLILKVRVVYNDGTPDLVRQQASLAAVPATTAVECCVGMRVMQLPGWSGRSIDRYQVWLENGSGGALSETKTFTVDYAWHEKVRTFLYQNSLGGFDSLRITGEQEDYLEYDRALFDRSESYSGTEQDHRLSVASVRERQSHKANTGWISEEATSAIRDFLTSEKVYLVDNGRLIPVVITSSQVRQRKDGEDLFSIDFEYRRSFENALYTRDVPSGSFNDDYNDDFENQ